MTVIDSTPQVNTRVLPRERGRKAKVKRRGLKSQQIKLFHHRALDKVTGICYGAMKTCGVELDCIIINLS